METIPTVESAVRAQTRGVEGLRIQLMGGFRVHVNERTVDETGWRLRKAKTLVKLLALAPSHQLPREQLTDLLWPDLDPVAAGNNLRKILHVARRALSPDPGATSRYVRQDGELVSLRAPELLVIDAEAFQAAAEGARRAADPEAAREALQLYAGDLLPEDRYEDWASRRREELREVFISLLLELARMEDARGNVGPAIEALRRVVAEDPASEESHAGLMRFHAQAGHRHQALRQYQQLRNALRLELDVEPDPETQRLHQEILQGTYPLKPVTGAPGRGHRAGEPQGASQPIIGRDGEIEILEEVLDGLFGGRGALVLLEGEAGVGKSRLAAEMAERARRRGATVLMGSGHEQEGRVPYGPFVEALDEFAREAAPADLRALVGDLGPELARLAPALGATPGSLPSAPDGQPERSRLFAAVASFFERLAAREPIVLVLDDLHAADEASLELLHYVVRTGRQLPRLIIGTFRPEDTSLSEVWGQFIASLGRERLAARLQLARLRSRESELLVTMLLGGSPADATVFEGVYDLAEGNPFYTEEAVRALREGGQLEEADGRWRLRQAISAVPGPLTELVAARLERLRPPARQVLNLAAVVGGEAPYWLLRAAGDGSESQILEALDECLVRRVLEESFLGYRFGHPLHRAVIYARLGRARRAVLHGRVAVAIEATDEHDLEGQAAVLAHHYELSEDPRRATPHLMVAGDRAASIHANDSAVRSYVRALELLGARDAPELAAQLQEKLGDLHGLMGEEGESEVDAYRAAIAAMGAGAEPSGLARLHRKAARACLRSWDADAAGPHLVAAGSLLAEQPDEAERGRLLGVSAHRFWQSGRYDEGVTAAEESIALAESHGGKPDLAAAYEVLAIVLHFRGEWKRGLQFEIEQLGTAVDEDADLALVVDMHHCLGQQHLYRDRSFDGVEEYARRILDLAVKTGARRAQAFAWCLLGEALLLRGQWDEAVGCLKRSIELRQELGPETVALPWQRLAEIAVYRGRPADAEEYLQHGMTIALVSPMARHAWGRLYATAGLNALEQSDTSGAVRAVEAAVLAGNEYGECPGCLSMLHPVAAEAYGAIGDADRATRHAKAIEQLAGRWDSTACKAMAETAWGSVAGARGDRAEATRRFLAAAEMYERVAQPFWAARSLLRAGRIQAEVGEADEARRLLERALASFEKLGAAGAEARTRREVAALSR